MYRHYLKGIENVTFICWWYSGPDLGLGKYFVDTDCSNCSSGGTEEEFHVGYLFILKNIRTSTWKFRYKYVINNFVLIIIIFLLFFFNSKNITTIHSLAGFF